MRFILTVCALITTMLFASARAFADRIPAPGQRAVALAEVGRLLKPKWQECILRDAVAAALAAPVA